VTLGLAVAGDALAQEFHPPPWVSATRCSDQDSIDADKAEGYSDAIAKLFANRWQTLREFANLSRQNPEFERFALAHIDTTVNLADDQAIIANARNHCPADLRAICKRLEAKAKNPN